MARGTAFPLGAHLRYPITISKLICKAGDELKKGMTAMEFSFKYTRDIDDQSTGDVRQEEQTGFATWPSPANGTLRRWHVKVGDVINSSRPCLFIEELCEHPGQLNGLCIKCGKSTDEVDWSTTQPETERAPIRMTHDQANLTVSYERAARTELEQQRRLLKHRKLSLVVDLDQTIIHACIDPTVGEWQRDPTNPNYDAVKDVQSFQLNDDGPRGLATGCSYYIKMRPRLRHFLDNVAKLYELHVYTMGTRAYAMNIAKIIDPDKKLFGDRVISRDENGNMTAKNLQRLFPVSTNMVVVIDDRADVWPNNTKNLIKVVPYDFFKGTGDINSPFLPRRSDLGPSNDGDDEKALESGTATSGYGGGNEAGSTEAPLDTSADTSSGGDDEALLKVQSEEQERALERQLTDRPLLHMQEQLDKQDAELAERTSLHSASTPPHQRHHVLLDDDAELKYLERHLTTLHQTYYDAYDSRDGTRNVPDIGLVLNELKSAVLRGTCICLSGIVPNNVIDRANHEVILQVKNFGAEYSERIHAGVTHLVASLLRPRTAKVREAAKNPDIKIVNQDWLQDSISQWEELDEKPYLLGVHPSDREGLEPLALPGRGEGNGPNAVAEAGPNGDGEEEELDSADEGEDVGPRSPIDDLKGFNFDEVDREFEEFMNEMDEDEAGDEASVDGDEKPGLEDGAREAEPIPSNKAKDLAVNGSWLSSKRKHTDADEDSEKDGGLSIGPTLSKKLRISSPQGGSKVRSAHMPESVSHELPAPKAAAANGGKDAGDFGTGHGRDDDEVVDLLQSDLDTNEEMDDIDEADLMAELDREEREALAEKG